MTEVLFAIPVWNPVRCMKRWDWGVDYMQCPRPPLAPNARRVPELSGELIVESSCGTVPGRGELRGRGVNVNRSGRRFCKGVKTWSLDAAKNIRDSQRWFAKRTVMFEHPSGQHRFGRLFEPLIDQNRDFPAQVSGVVQASELEALQGGT